MDLGLWRVGGIKVQERLKGGEKRGGRTVGFEGQSKKAGCMRIAWGKEEMDTSGHIWGHGNQVLERRPIASERVKLLHVL